MVMAVVVVVDIDVASQGKAWHAQAVHLHGVGAIWGPPRNGHPPAPEPKSLVKRSSPRPHFVHPFSDYALLVIWGPRRRI